MKMNIYSLLKGRFLTEEDAPGNWSFIIYLSLLAMVMISSAHRAEQKVMMISALNKEVKSLRSEYVDVKSKLMILKLESTIKPIMHKRGLNPSEDPPVKIVVSVPKK
ncbi:MAG: S-adenosyl-methyltransferase [Flavobacteriales bacterium CG_4_9_14_3_um_filter_40_17]|nr:MAG: S-adenosyl-methyltransferase [Flavobacteriales bacterium CG_4_9_14_3_um_filter_40_17]